jgi:4-amino-4-deoxy-L-arabinose transferase-like glycosyltransferase
METTGLFPDDVMISMGGNSLNSGWAETIRPGRSFVRRDSLWIFSLGAIIFTFGLAPEFIGFDARFALFAQEMLRKGPTFFPTVFHTPYPDYPGSSTFLIYLVSLPFGRVTPFSVALPTAIVSALILVVTYGIGALQSRQRGIAAVLLALFTVEFLAMSRSAALDQYTSLATALSFYLIYSSDRLGRHRRLWLVPMAWVLGFAFRGPMGLLVPAVVTCAYLLWNGRFQQTLSAGILAAGLLVLCLVSLLAAARAQGGTPFQQQVIDAQMASRFGDRGQGFAYYWYAGLTSYAVAYPLTILVVAFRLRDLAFRKTDQDKFVGNLISWAVAVLLMLSIPASKKTRYMVSIVPALSLIASSLIVDAPVKGFLLQAKRTFLGVCACLPGLSIVGLGGLLVFAYWWRPEWYTCCLATSILLAAPLAVARRLDRQWKTVPGQSMYLLAVGAATFVVVNVGLVDPIMYSLEKTTPFVRQVEALWRKTPATVSFLQMSPDGLPVKFSANLTEPLEPRFVRSIDALPDVSRPHYFIATEAVFRSLPVDTDTPMRQLVRGKIGHTDCVMFVLEQT